MQAKILLFYDLPHLLRSVYCKATYPNLPVTRTVRNAFLFFQLVVPNRQRTKPSGDASIFCDFIASAQQKIAFAPEPLTGRRWRTTSTRRSGKNLLGRKHRRARLPDHALVFPKTSRLSRKTRRLFATSSRVFFSLTRVGAHTQRVFVFYLHPSPPNSKH